MNPSFFNATINNYLPEPQASLLKGIIFGISLKTSKLFYQQLKIVGLLHIVVLSGINITILASIVASLTKFLNKKTSIFITIFTIVIFILFVGPQAPIIRAGIMGILTLVAVLYGRKAAALYILFLSALLTLIFKPDWLKTISFQLSYGATLGIIIFGPAYQTGQNFGKIRYLIWKELKPSLAAQLFTVPIIFFYFKQISFISPVANLLVSFIIPPLMVFGFLTVILGSINFYLGVWPGFISYLLLSYIVFVIENLSKIPYAFYQFR